MPALKTFGLPAPENLIQSVQRPIDVMSVYAMA